MIYTLKNIMTVPQKKGQYTAFNNIIIVMIIKTLSS